MQTLIKKQRKEKPSCQPCWAAQTLPSSTAKDTTTYSPCSSRDLQSCWGMKELLFLTQFSPLAHATNTP